MKSQVLTMSILSIVSFAIAAFGQPALVWWLGPLAASAGFALFWRTLLDVEMPKSRFLRGTLWFFCVQLVQLYWLLSHPYIYIYPVYFVTCLVMGLQFGYVSTFITRENIQSAKGIAVISALFVIMEWARLFILSGFSWNPVGLYLGTTLYGLQGASLFGVYGLSFWVIMTNLLALNLLLSPRNSGRAALFLAAAASPYLYGWAHYQYHDSLSKKQDAFQVVLAQTAFPVEEIMGISTHSEFVAYVMDEWEKIFEITKKNSGAAVDLVVFPEFVVPLGTYNFVYPYEEIKERFERQYGSENLKHLPPLQLPFAKTIQTDEGRQLFVNNAFLAQAIANTFNAPLLLGLEDVEEVSEGQFEYYSAALLIQPNGGLDPSWPYHSERYEKRVLVPMGEYIPFAFLRELAKSYGIHGSFTPGKEGKVLNRERLPIGVSICYEETFGALMLESRQRGAEVLANLTSDIWYPDSTLTLQHLEHARLRTVEAGVPLVRSCNTGITCAIDSLGRTIASLPEYDGEGKWLADSLLARVSKYHYPTLYTKVGDLPVIGGSALSLVLFLFGLRREKILIQLENTP